jgi:1,2-phenylacetyl-CoA epoxidase catalytic subunit
MKITLGRSSDRVKIKVIKEGPGHIARTIDACCKDPSQTVFAQALLDKALEDYFLIQLAMLANTKVNAYVTIAAWKKAGLRLPGEDMPRRQDAGAIACHTTET